MYPNFTLNKNCYLGQKQRRHIGKEYRREDPVFFRGQIRIRIKMGWIRNTDHKIIPFNFLVDTCTFI
jgi:hypothetical protein